MKKLLFLFTALLLVGAGCLSSDSGSEDTSVTPDTSTTEDTAIDYTTDYDGVVDAYICTYDTTDCEDTSAWFEDGELTELLIGYDWTAVVGLCDTDVCYAVDIDGGEWEVYLD